MVRRQTKRALVVTLAAVVAALVMLGCLQRWVIFPRYVAKPDPEAVRGVPGLERLWLETDSGRVEAYFLPGAGVNATHPGPALIFAHGNGELIDHWPQWFAPYRQLGISILLPEYRGYGRSGGSPSQVAIVSDFERFYELLAARPEVDEQRIVFQGRSLGGGVVCALAARHQPAALILTSTFTSIRAMAKRYHFPGSLIQDPFDNLSVLRTLDVPVLLGHGDRDRTVPLSQARELRAAARQAKLIIEPGSGHDYPRDQLAFFAEVASFLRQTGLLEEQRTRANPPPVP